MKKFFALFLAIPMLFLASCDNETKRSLGIVRNTPDEYAVIKHPPLSVPPSFELNPPEENAKPREVDTTIQFAPKDDKEKVSNPKKESNEMSDADKKFSSKFNKYKKRSDIRGVISEENKKEEESRKELQKKRKANPLEVIKSWF